MKVRAVRTENRLTHGSWCADVHQGQVFVVDGSGAAGTIDPTSADYLVAHGAMIPVEDEAVHDAWFRGRAENPDGVPAPEESRVGTHFDRAYGNAPMIDGDVGGGYIHVSVTTADPNVPQSGPVPGPSLLEADLPATPTEGA